MAEFVIMPKQGLQMTEGTIISWLVEEGTQVAQGDSLFEMETDKLTISIPSAADGTLLKILHPAGDTVPITMPIAVIGDVGEDISVMLAESGKDTPAQTDVAEENQGKAVQYVSKTALSHASDENFSTPRAQLSAEQRGIDIHQVTGSGPDDLIIERDVLNFTPISAVKATPLARKVAARENVDLQFVDGTGSHNKITVADVQNTVALRGQSREQREEVLIPFSGMRKVVASRMKESLLEMAQANHRISVNMSEAVRLRELLKKSNIKVSYNDIVLRCVAKALTEFPEINSSWGDQGIIQKKYINLGMAVAVKEGLIVPVIQNTDLMNLREIALCSSELVQKAKGNQLVPDDYKGGTFTVSNLGMYDLDSFTAIINPPEAGILAVGKLAKQPVAEGDEIVIRPMMQLSLTYDHRIVDGAPAALFLRRAKELLENPGLLI